MKFLFHKPKSSSLAADVSAGIIIAAMFYGILYLAIFKV
jgi:hypothetical protein